jgi:hypothetical protein
MSTMLGPADVVQAIVRAVNGGDVDGALELIATAALDQGQAVSHADWRRKWEEGLLAHGLKLVTERTVENGEWVANVHLLRGTLDSAGAETRVMDMVRVVDGRLVEHWFFVEPKPA